MAFVNQYSFVIFGVTGTLALIIMAWRWQRPPLWLRIAAVIAFAAGMIAGQIGLGYRQNFDGRLASAEEILENGQPTFLMFYSDY